MKEVPFNILLGKILSGVYVEDEKIIFTAEDGTFYQMYHQQDCCEQVDLEDVCGDVADLIGTPILEAEERISEDNPQYPSDESWTWTFYHLRTIKGTVTIRWYGSSNGYYSESVNFASINFLPKDFLQKYGLKEVLKKH